MAGVHVNRGRVIRPRNSEPDPKPATAKREPGKQTKQSKGKSKPKAE